MGLKEELIENLSQTPYACSKLEQVAGGMMNFTFRGQLVDALFDGSKTVIIKHGEDYGSEAADIFIPTSRCVVEQDMLRRLESACFQPLLCRGISVRSPRFYDFNPQTTTQIMEDVANSERLFDMTKQMDHSIATEIGEALGKWLGCFHDWASKQDDPGLLKTLEPNHAVQEAIHRGMDQQIRARGYDPAVTELTKELLTGEDGAGRGVIYGDITTKNVLYQTAENGGHTRLSVIDWEACRIGFRMQDIGVFAMINLIQYHLEGCQAALPMVHGFTSGYGPVADELVFQAAVFSGLYLLHWDMAITWTPTPDQVDGLVKIADELIIMGAQKDRQSIKKTFLGGLLRS
ncbi:hypothetical protein N7478_000213 [Penicillium angulare]|uniref:uncharacterized protein n=1 Tax=Penicillium angulare TaxID=116970 RepID=UPI0025410C9E|nr:uncharacterized protein N7478_000213 [Penicillium angulare]KAJ5290962.1 hypothetical protein N7478_000213 [Penicillium angulare]